MNPARIRQSMAALVVLSLLTLSSCAKEGAGTQPDEKSTKGTAPLSMSKDLDGLALQEEKGKSEEIPPNLTPKQKEELFDKSFKETKKLFFTGRFDDAAVKSEIVVKLRPDFAQGHYFRAKSIQQSLEGDDEEARKSYIRALELDPKITDANEELSRIYYSNKEYDKALAQLDMAIKEDPTVPNFFKHRAAVYSELGRSDDAMKDLRSLIKLRPGSSYPYLTMGSMLIAKGRKDEALECFSKATQLEANNPDILSSRAFQLRAELLSEMNQPEEAIKDLSIMIKKDPQNDDAYRNRANQLMKLKKFDRAIKDYTKAIELMPEFARASYEARARAYEKMGKPELARADLEKAKKIKSKPAEKPLFKLESKNRYE